MDKRLLKNITILRGNETYLNKDFALSFRNPEVLPQMLKFIDEEVIQVFKNILESYGLKITTEY